MKPLDALAIRLAGIQLIEASAGTGKTHTITTLFVRLLLERELGVDQILVVTFTKAATAELRERVRRRLAEACRAFEGRSSDAELVALAERSADRAASLARLGAALSDFDQASIFTIHGFCQRALAEHAFESRQSFDLELTTDHRSLLAELVADFWSTELGRASPAQVAFVTERKDAFERWQRLARQVAAAPDMPLVPEPRPSSVDVAVGRYLALREEAKACFSTAKPDIERLLSNQENLKRNTYDLGKLPDWLEDVAAWLAHDEPTLGSLGTGVEKLSQQSLAAGTKKGGVIPRHAFFELCEEARRQHDAARTELEAWLVEVEHRLAERVRSELPRRKRELGVQTFDDLLLSLEAALSGPTGDELGARLAQRYPVALVDEFQDTDPVQYRIFRRVYLGTKGALFLIGDPKQAIYAFRGADIFSYLAAARDAGADVHTLAVSYRSDPSLVAATNTLFSRAERPFVLDGIELTPVQPKPGAKDELSRQGRRVPPFQVAFVDWEEDAGNGGYINKGWPELPRRFAAHVAALLASGLRVAGRPLEPGDVAILTRTNQQAFEIQAELGKLAVPSVLLGDRSVLERDEAAELGFVMRALGAPTRETAVLTALSTSLFGLALHELEALRQAPERFEAHSESFRRWQGIWQRHGFVHAFRALLRDSGAVAKLLGLSDGERRLTNFLHLAEIVHRAAVERGLGIAGLVHWFDEVRLDPTRRGELAPEALQLRLESDAKAVKLTTMHKSKGLEYEVVLCPQLWDGTFDDSDLTQFHDPARGGQSVLSLAKLEKGSAERELAEREQRAESMRLCYVALTRAKRLTSVVWGRFRTGDTSPLGSLLHAGGSGRTAVQIVHELDGPGLRRDLGRVCKALPESLEVVELTRRAERRRDPAARSLELAARPITRRVELRSRSSSFTALVRSAEPETLPAVEGRDFDAVAEDDAPRAPEPGAPRVPLDAFPRGAKAGDALHQILEQLDFTRAEPRAIEPVARAGLGRHGIDAAWSEPLSRALADVLVTPLTAGASPVRLVEVPSSRRLVELEFTFPVADPTGRRLRAADLAQAFAAVPDGLPQGYASRLGALAFAPLAGFLRGFVDLVVEHGGRYWVIDYKSNHLGSHPSDYAPDRLARSMAEHHYFLQYHLYVVALCRYLATRVQGFDYDRHFGGALYLFLRGIAPGRGPATGVFFERPPRARVQALDAALGLRMEEP